MGKEARSRQSRIKQEASTKEESNQRMPQRLWDADKSELRESSDWKLTGATLQLRPLNSVEDVTCAGVCG